MRGGDAVTSGQDGFKGVDMLGQQEAVSQRCHWHAVCLQDMSHPL